MDTAKTLSFPAVSKKTAVFALFLAVTAGIPAVIHSQFITGPIVNAALLLATVVMGPLAAVMLGVTSSPIALASGTLPLALAPMVPFIMLGNAILVLAFYAIYKKSFLGAVAVAAVVKYAFLAGTVSLLMSTMLSAQLTQTLALMMGIPQLVTALAGGLIAYIALLGRKA